MRTLWCSMGIVAMVTLAAAAQGPGPTDQDKTAVREAAYGYAEGYYEGAADRMERAISPFLIKRGLMTRPDGASLLVPMNADTLVEATRQGGGKSVLPDNRNITFELLDIRENVASAKAFTAMFNDYLHLVKQDGRWRIANVLWQPPSPKGIANADADKAAVGQTVKDFLDALSAGDAARLERLVHPEAALRTYRANPAAGRFFIVEGNRDAALAQARAKNAPPVQNPGVTVLDVYDTIASALTTHANGLFYWHLGKQNDQWRVVNLLRR